MCLVISITLIWESHPHQWGKEEVIKIQVTCRNARGITLVVTLGTWLWDLQNYVFFERRSMPDDSRVLVSDLCDLDHTTPVD